MRHKISLLAVLLICLASLFPGAGATMVPGGIQISAAAFSDAAGRHRQ